MRVVSKTLQYELTPEEREDNSLEREIRLHNNNGDWEAVKVTPKHRMQFDANYNRYYAKVTYDRTT